MLHSMSWTRYHSVWITVILMTISACIAHGGHDHHLGDDPHLHSHDHHHHNHHHGHHHGHHHERLEQSNWFSDFVRAMLATLAISILPFLLLLAMPVMDDQNVYLQFILSFSAGALLGDAFLHLIPHAAVAMWEFNVRNDIESVCTFCGWLVLAGFFSFLVMDRVIHAISTCCPCRTGNICQREDEYGYEKKNKKKKKEQREDHNDDEEEEEKEQRETVVGPASDGSEQCDGCPRRRAAYGTDKVDSQANEPKQSSVGRNTRIGTSGILSLIADFSHNFTDGMALGASFMAGRSIGYVTAFSILFHEIPHELGDYALLIRSGVSSRQAKLLQLVTAVGSLLGCVMATFAFNSEQAQLYILPLTAGGFIYIATVSIIPDDIINGIDNTRDKASPGRLKASSAVQVISMIAGILCMAIAGYLE